MDQIKCYHLPLGAGETNKAASRRVVQQKSEATMFDGRETFPSLYISMYYDMSLVSSMNTQDNIFMRQNIDFFYFYVQDIYIAICLY